MMGISFWEAPVLFLFAAAYRMLDMLAMMLTLAAPRGFRTKFDW
jgi:hypothetical protein